MAIQALEALQLPVTWLKYDQDLYLQNCGLLK